MVHSRTVWEGGTESHTFNRLEEIALDWRAKTPVLGSRISRVLESKVIGADYLPSRINWVVQVAREKPVKMYFLRLKSYLRFAELRC